MLSQGEVNGGIEVWLTSIRLLYFLLLVVVQQPRATKKMSEGGGIPPDGLGAWLTFRRRTSPLACFTALGSVVA